MERKEEIIHLVEKFKKEVNADLKIDGEQLEYINQYIDSARVWENDHVYLDTKMLNHFNIKDFSFVKNKQEILLEYIEYLREQRIKKREQQNESGCF